MKIEDIIKTKIKERKTTQSELAEVAGFRGQTNIAGILNNTKNGMRVDNALTLLHALDCDIVIIDRKDGNKWTVTKE